MSLGADNVERLAEREGYVAANMNSTVRLIGGLLVALAILGAVAWVIL
jgi:flagellar biogenesis protein FliO